ncbi:hypothetical protein AX16_000233 [Volvariella volvacea WC 439]|nr:hypothetical protein AX16_000233 [Volvariella volvacea WC 439]
MAQSTLVSTARLSQDPPQSLSQARSKRAEPISNALAAPIRPLVPSTHHKKTTRHGGKPIINWFQRKLSGTTKVKRSEQSTQRSDSGRSQGRTTISSSRPSRISSPPLSPVARHTGRLDANGTIPRKTISLNGDDELNFYSTPINDDDGDASADESSMARISTWSPTSAMEADEDASVRPIPPSIPPSPSPSRSSSSYLSNPRTFRSIAASTKPTTLLSIDLQGGGMAHIAQAPLTPTSQMNNRFMNHARTSSNATSLLGPGGAVTFSSLQQSSRPPSGSLPPPSGQLTVVQAPLHTAHHPRNNPRPSSPPPDNASILTLASSAFAIPGLRTTSHFHGHSIATTPSALGPSDSLSHFGGSFQYADAESTSQFVLGDDERLEERDVDASVRALRPRSSRRNSWESEVSRWSARIQTGPGTPSLARNGSLWASNSVRTGGFSGENGEDYEQSEETEEASRGVELSPYDLPQTDTITPDERIERALPSPVGIPLPIIRNEDAQPIDRHASESHSEGKSSSDTVPGSLPTVMYATERMGRMTLKPTDERDPADSPIILEKTTATGGTS